MCKPPVRLVALDMDQTNLPRLLGVNLKHLEARCLKLAPDPRMLSVFTGSEKPEFVLE